MKGIVFIIKLLLVILMLAFIWGQSLMPGDLSSRESEYFLTLVRPVVEALQRVLAAGGIEVSQSLLVRKMAHFTEYMVLGGLMFLLFVKPDGRSRYILPAMLCLGTAGIDEGLQVFVANRGPALRDVGLDFAGSCVGILIAAFFILVLYYGALRRRKARRGRVSHG